MMIPFQGNRKTSRRQGLTLLEVLIALAIFFMSIMAISNLVDMARERAEEAGQRSIALLVAESKVAEMKAGVTALSSGNGNWDTDDRYIWTADVQAMGPILYQVTITAQREGFSRSKVELVQYLADPQALGSTMDAIPEETGAGTDTSGTTTPTTGSSSSPSGGTSGTPSK